MAPFGVTRTAIRETTPLSWTIKPYKAPVEVPVNYDEETYFTPKGSLDRLLRDSRFLSVLKTVNKVPRIMSWIEEACSGGCPICQNAYPEQCRMAISMCGHTMCDACLQRVMGDKMNFVYCPSCRKEILVVLILDRPKKQCSLDNVKYFLLQDDTPVHDPTLMLGSLLHLWRHGKEYPITMTPCSVEPVPALHGGRRGSKECPVVFERLKTVGQKNDHEEESYNRKSESVIQSLLSHLGTDEDPFLNTSTIKEGDLIDWNLLFGDDDGEPNANAQLVWPRPYHPTKVIDDLGMNCNFFNFQTSDDGKPCNNVGAEKRATQTSRGEVDSDGSWLGDSGVGDLSTVHKTLSPFEHLIAQLPMDYKQREPSTCLPATFISEGKILRRRLECPQWIMRVQVVPVVFESQIGDLIQLD